MPWPVMPIASILLAVMLLTGPARGGEPIASPAPRTQIQLASIFTASDQIVRPSGSFEKWAQVLARTKGGSDPCPSSAAECAYWRRVVTELRAIDDEAELLARVNDVINAAPYVSDRDDYWETPVDFLRYGGDCEDFAIAKYFLLRQLGISDSDLRIAIVGKTSVRPMHAVLVVATRGAVAVLDNAVPDVIIAGRTGYAPAVAVNQRSLWVFLPKVHQQPLPRAASRRG